MKNWQSQSNSKVKGKNMLAHYSLDCFYQKKKKIRGTKKKKFFQKITYLNLRLNQNKFRKNAQA